jgi:hypothetical protein
MISVRGSDQRRHAPFITGVAARPRCKQLAHPIQITAT